MDEQNRVSLLYDSRREPRTLLFKVGILSVDVLIQERNGRQVLYGQMVAGPQASPVPGVEVEVGDDSAVTDEHGEFAVTVDGEVDAGRFRIRAPALEFLCAVPARSSET